MSYLWRYTFSQNKRALFNRFCHILHFKQDKCEFIQSSSLLRIAKYYLYKKLVRDAYSRTGSAKLHQLHGTSWVSTDQHRSTLTVPVNNLTVKVVFIFFCYTFYHMTVFFSFLAHVRCMLMISYLNIQESGRWQTLIPKISHIFWRHRYFTELVLPPDFNTSSFQLSISADEFLLFFNGT